MPATTDNPHLRTFLSEPWNETVLGQLIIRRKENGFELRHSKDKNILTTDLKPIRLADVRQLANFTSDGKFRPLKSMPDLASGWILALEDPKALELALQTFYPNGLADLYATRSWPPPVTSYRNFTKRQTGMYRITTLLKDGDVAHLVQMLCESNCVKFRLWEIESSEPITGPLPFNNLVCLEPCAVFLEAARKEVRAFQEKSASGYKADSAADPG